MTSKRHGFTFPEILPRLVVAYETGRLVPFIGVGMSRPHCADWEGLIRGLEDAAGIDRAPSKGTSAPSRAGGSSMVSAGSNCAGGPSDATPPEDLIRRANRAVRKLRASREGVFDDALAKALFVRKDSVPDQTQALADIWWPLVLTTNYDDFYVDAFGHAFDPRFLAVVGRGSEDCQRVLSSLRVAGRALLWALQGHVAGPRHVKGHDEDKQLSAELVIDHAEYRRVTYREPHFRRAFAEVFRNRSFLFLGSGLKESYLQELFGEVLELYGPSTREHYAIMPSGEVDPQFMYARFQIAVVEYGEGQKAVDHGYVPARLRELGAAVRRADTAAASWSWETIALDGSNGRGGSADLEIVRGPLPTRRRRGECLVVSAGGSLDQAWFHVSPELQPTLDAWCGGPAGQPRQTSPYVGEYDGCDAFAVRARAEHKDVKDLLAVRAAAGDLFDIAAPKYRCIRMQLLASGGKDQGEEPRWSARPFPARFALMEMVRAWANWRRHHADRHVTLVLHIVDPSVTRELVSGRIDVLELLRCPDISFWAEMVDRRVLLERRRFQQDDETTRLEAVVEELGIDPDYWEIEVSPPSDIDASAGAVALNGNRHGVALTSLSLRALGVVPGSTLHFRRIQVPGGRGAAVTSRTESRRRPRPSRRDARRSTR